MQILYINSVNITMDDTNQNVGAGLYILSSFYNHSCVPNTTTSFPDNNTWHLYANKNIKEGQYIFETQHKTTTCLDSPSLSKSY